MDQRESGSISRTYLPYPNWRVWRMKLALGVFAGGWALWWVAMFLPATWQFSNAVDTSYLMVLIFGGGLLFPLKMFGGAPGAGSVVLLGFCCCYCLALMGMWLPLVFRQSSAFLWIWRTLSLALLTPIYEVYWQYSREYPTGPGTMIWVAGSVLIGLSVWLSPPRWPEEPRFVLTLFRRLSGGYLLVTTTPPRRTGRAFPVMQSPAATAISGQDPSGHHPKK